MARKIIFIIILLNSVTIKGEISQIQDSQIDNHDISSDLLEVMPWLEGDKTVNDYANKKIPIFGGDRLPDDFGESRYDKNIPWQRLERQSLNEIRVEKKNEEAKSIRNNLIIGGIFLLIIFFLIRMSKKTNINQNDLL